MDFNLVIVAGGLGSRLAPLTNHIPKFLVNIGKETGFVEQIRFWMDHCPESITVIVHSDYKDLVSAYYDLYFGHYQLPFHVKTVDEANGSAHAIATSCEHLVDQPVMFSWCDVMPGEKIDINTVDGNMVFLNYDYPNRYDLAEGRTYLRADGRGGIFGLYFIEEYRTLEYAVPQDFVDIIGDFEPTQRLSSYMVRKIIDWGDKPKLERVRETADKARSFNFVQVHGDLVLKGANNAQGKELIAKELCWYEELSNMNSSVSRPNHWAHANRTSFVMERVQGVPIWNLWPTLDEAARAIVFNRILEQFNKMHAIKCEVGNAIVLRDVTIEAHTKLLSRYKEIKACIDGFGPVETVNNWRLQFTPEETIDKLFAELLTHYTDTKEYSIIHGDLQMSNSMVDPDSLEVTFIDPRGYFGQSLTYGLPDYDYAKMLYSLSGYDLFNYSKTFSIYKHEKMLSFDIEQPNTNGVELKTFECKHHLWLAVCWIGLAQYIKSDPVKMVAAHYHGLAMAERLLTEHTRDCTENE